MPTASGGACLASPCWSPDDDDEEDELKRTAPRSRRGRPPDLGSKQKSICLPRPQLRPRPVRRSEADRMCPAILQSVLCSLRLQVLRCFVRVSVGPPGRPTPSHHKSWGLTEGTILRGPSGWRRLRKPTPWWRPRISGEFSLVVLVPLDLEFTCNVGHRLFSLSHFSINGETSGCDQALRSGTRQQQPNQGRRSSENARSRMAMEERGSSRAFVR